jgi:hypothetical protein
MTHLRTDPVTVGEEIRIRPKLAEKTSFTADVLTDILFRLWR